MKLILLMCLFCFFFLSLDAQAGFRCKGKILSSSYSKLDVKNYCGEPLLVDRYNKIIQRDNAGEGPVEKSCETVDQWYYNYDLDKSTYVIEFERGFLVRVKKGQVAP